MPKTKRPDSAKEPLEDEWASLRALAETPVRQPGRELTLEEFRQRIATSKGVEAEFYAQLLAIKEGKVEVWQPSMAPLPSWTMQGDGLGSSSRRSCGYTCNDPAEQAFALAVMMMTGFSVPDFDIWLDSIGFSDARTELIIRREWVGEALHANNEDGVRRHLEWMVNRRREIQDKQVLMPLAQRDAKRQAGTRKPRRPKIDAWIEAQLTRDPDAKAPTLWGRAPEWIQDDIGPDRFAKRVTKCRKKVASK